MDIWPAVLAYPAFFGGLAFSAVLGIAGRRRRFSEDRALLETGEDVADVGLTDEEARELLDGGLDHGPR